jgi:hypothetical protein
MSIRRHIDRSEHEEMGHHFSQLNFAFPQGKMYQSGKANTHPQDIVHQSTPPWTELDKPDPSRSTLRDPLGRQEES